MSLEPSTVINLGLALWEQKKRIDSFLRNLRRRLNQGKVVIAVFGAGGVGKTTLGRTLTSSDLLLTKPEIYRESRETETYWVASNQNQSILVAPGQERRMEAYWPAIRKQLIQAKKAAIIIHVVAYGHHALGAGLTLDDTPEARVAYLDISRDRELEVIDDLANFLRQNDVPKVKMITLVTKQDLWWNERDAVKRHYELGEYAKRIAEIQAVKGTQHFVHEFGYAALCLQNLKTSDGKIIALTASGFDGEAYVFGFEQAIDLIERYTK